MYLPPPGVQGQWIDLAYAGQSSLPSRRSSEWAGADLASKSSMPSMQMESAVVGVPSLIIDLAFSTAAPEIHRL